MAKTPARQAHVVTGPGDVNMVCPACGQGDPHGDDDPRHIGINSGPLLSTEATLPDGTVVPIQVRKDVAFHFDCHAAMGCDHCKRMLEHHDGSVKGKAPLDSAESPLDKPDDLVDVEPYEFDLAENAVLRRVRTKEEAAELREREQREAGFDVVSHHEARELHAAHSAEKAGAV